MLSRTGITYLNDLRMQPDMIETLNTICTEFTKVAQSRSWKMRLPFVGLA
jgi:hypothetical protein